MKSVYKVELEGLLDGMVRVSLVKNPAIKENFLAFSDEEERKMSFLDDEKKQIVGAVLVPDLKIHRNNKKLGPIDIVFTRETIEEINYKFNKENIEHKFNIHHQDTLAEAVLLESWIKESDVDKSSSYGMKHLPEGTLFFKVQVESDELWSRIKQGEFQGFSAEIFANLTELKTINNFSMEKFEFEAEGVKYIFPSGVVEGAIALSGEAAMDGAIELEKEGKNYKVEAENGVIKSVVELEGQPADKDLTTLSNELAEVKGKVGELVDIIKEQSGQIEKFKSETEPKNEPEGRNVLKDLEALKNFFE